MTDYTKEKTVESGTIGFIEEIDKVKVSPTEEANRALLYMLEDLNGMISSITRAKKEWEDTVDSMIDPLFIHDSEFKIIRCNRAYRELAGSATFKEIVGKPYFEVFPKLVGPFRMYLESEGGEEEIFVPAIGRTFNVRFFTMKNTHGGLLSYVHTMEDITERKMMEERYKTIIKTSMEGFWMVDTKGRILDVNDAFCKMTGYSRDEMLKMFIQDVELSETPEITAQHIQLVIERGWDRFESRHRCKDRRIIDIEVSAQYMKVDEGRIVVFIRDITERKRVEEAIRQEMDITNNLLRIVEATVQLTDLDKFIATVVLCVWEIMACDTCFFYMWDGEARLFRPCEEKGLGQNLRPYFRNEPIAEDVPCIKKAIEAGIEVVEGIAIEDTLLKAPGCGFFRLIENLDRLIVIPLAGKNGYRGLIICIYARAERPIRQFRERDKKLVSGIASQVSIAMENAILYKNSLNSTIELSRKIETIQVMHDIDKSILSTLDSKEILETVVIMVSRIISCDLIMVALADYEKKGFHYTAGFGIDSFKKGGFVPFEDTSATEVIKTGRPQYIANLTEITGLLPLEKILLDEGFLSHMRMPLTVKGDSIGILSIGVKRSSAFTPDDLSTLEKLSSQIGVALENSRLIQDVEDLFISTVRALSNTIDAKSPWTNGHSERVTKTAIDIAREMGFPDKELKKLEVAGLLHDIGKIGTYETILNKSGKLTEEELNIIRQHPKKGAEILGPIKQLKEAIPVLKHHHEFYDGNGYPDGLKGEDIPLMARVLAVADSVDAMGADRPYRKGRPMEEIIAELKRCSGTQFDAKIVEAFLRLKQS